VARFRLSPAARQDLDDIFEFSVQRWDLDQAFRYTDALVSAFKRFAESPALAQDCSDIARAIELASTLRE
jgi:toxin ParE1/3/4